MKLLQKNFLKKKTGWFQGKMEFGPRALGARSIIADPGPVECKGFKFEIKFRKF